MSRADLEAAARPTTPPAPEKVYLCPGRMLVSPDPRIVTTILGSCVAVCLWDSGLRVGGINHFLLPHWAGSRQPSPRYGNMAMEQLIEEMLALGGRRQDLRAKVCGGARVLDVSKAGNKDLGTRNVEIARKILSRVEIPVVAQDVGGDRGRKVTFRTANGSVEIRRI